MKILSHLVSKYTNISKAARWFLYKFFHIISIRLPSNIFNDKSFKDYANDNNINKKYLDLVKHLDLRSKVIVDKILNRVINKSIFNYAYRFSKSELKQFAKQVGYSNRVADFDTDFNSTEYFKNIYPGFKEYEIPVFLFHHGLFLMDQNFVNKYFKNKVCIDGGAYTFDSAVVLSGHYEFERIYSFELDKRNYLNGKELLEKKYSNLTNIEPLNLGLWSSNAYAESTTDKMLSKIKNTEKNQGDHILVSIDNFSKNQDVKVGFVKLDVEGAEYEIIKGCKETIKRDLPIMSISIYHTVKDFFEIKPLIESFVPDKYDYYVRKLAPSYYQYETYLICIPKSLNLKLNNYEDIDIYG